MPSDRGCLHQAGRQLNRTRRAYATCKNPETIPSVYLLHSSAPLLACTCVYHSEPYLAYLTHLFRLLIDDADSTQSHPICPRSLVQTGTLCVCPWKDIPPGTLYGHVHMAT